MPIHRELSAAEAPIIRRLLSWLVGWHYDGSQAARERIVTELPVIGLRPSPRG